MANDQNLNNRAATQFRAGEEQVRIAKKVALRQVKHVVERKPFLN